MLRILRTAIAAVLFSVHASAFTQTYSAVTRSTYLRSTDPETALDSLSDYLARAHDEKLRAIKEVETKKNAEIAVSTTFKFRRCDSL